MQHSNQHYIPFTRGPVQGAIAILAILTALAHLYLAFILGITTSAFPIFFLLNSIGYLVLLVALYSPQLAGIQRPIRWLLILYTLLTIILYFVFRYFTLFGYTDKMIEVLLIALLVVEEVQAASHKKVTEHSYL